MLREPENPEVDADVGLHLGEIEFSFPLPFPCLVLTLINDIDEAETLCLDKIVPPLEGGRLAAEDDDVCARLVCLW